LLLLLVPLGVGCGFVYIWCVDDVYRRWWVFWGLGRWEKQGGKRSNARWWMHLCVCIVSSFFLLLAVAGSIYAYAF
jgi:hypothetical protein